MVTYSNLKNSDLEILLSQKKEQGTAAPYSKSNYLSISVVGTSLPTASSVNPENHALPVPFTRKP